MTTLEINTLLDNFIDGIDTSIDLANRIEVLLDDTYPDDDFIQETVEILACYRPEGGDFLFDTNQVRKRLVETKEYLN